MYMKLQSIAVALICILAVCAKANSVPNFDSLDIDWQMELKTSDEEESRRKATSNCKSAVEACATHFSAVYSDVEDNLTAILERTRSIELADHCRRAREVMTCSDQVLRNDNGLCAEVMSRMDVARLQSWSDVLNLVCGKRFNEFKLHYRCLLLEKVAIDVPDRCEKSIPYEEKRKAPCRSLSCYGRETKALCGLKASAIMMELMWTILTVAAPFFEAQESLPSGSYNCTDLRSQADALLTPFRR